jgi:hypothetical protein
MNSTFKSLAYGFTLYLSILISACGAYQADKQGDIASDVASEKSLSIKDIPIDTPSEKPIPKPIDLASECKKYIGQIMGRSPASMQVDHQSDPGSLVGVSYIRSDDGKKFIYECKTDGSTIVWRGVDIFGPGEGPGRWRDEEAKPISSI